MLKLITKQLLSITFSLLFLCGCSEDFSYLFSNIEIKPISQSALPTTLPKEENTSSTITPSLKILSQPQSITVEENQAFTLSVKAQSHLPVRYQWYKDNININGATQSSYSVPKSKAWVQGFYHVVLKTEQAELRSLSARVNYSTQPATPKISLAIIKSPLSQSLKAGEALQLNASISGVGPFRYQWLRYGAIIPGAIRSNYYVASSQGSDSGNYQLKVSNAERTVYSKIAAVSVTPTVEPVQILTQPTSLLVTEQSAARFSVLARSSGWLRYQWRKNGIPLQNASLASFSLPRVSQADAGLYDVVVSNNLGSVYSKKVSLQVLTQYEPLKISQQPLSQRVARGSPFTVSVSVESDSLPSYQWFRNGYPISGARSSSYRITDSRPEDQASYHVLVKDANDSVRSENAFISLIEPETAAIELSWDTPKTREDGSPLATWEIQAYLIEYGGHFYELNQRVRVTHQEANRYVLKEISPGTLYLRIATIDSEGFQGAFSEPISVNIN